MRIPRISPAIRVMLAVALPVMAIALSIVLRGQLGSARTGHCDRLVFGVRTLARGWVSAGMPSACDVQNWSEAIDTLLRTRWIPDDSVTVQGKVLCLDGMTRGCNGSDLVVALCDPTGPSNSPRWRLLGPNLQDDGGAFDDWDWPGQPNAGHWHRAWIVDWMPVVLALTAASVLVPLRDRASLPLIAPMTVRLVLRGIVFLLIVPKGRSSVDVSSEFLYTMLIVLATLTLVDIWYALRTSFKARVARRRADRGECEVCSYKLLTSSDRCPECGTVHAGVASTSLDAHPGPPRSPRLRPRDQSSS